MDYDGFKISQIQNKLRYFIDSLDLWNAKIKYKTTLG